MAYVNLLEIVYPIGSIYISAVNTSPSTIVGGSWVQITGDACLMASNTTGNVGSKKISKEQMPKHSHKPYQPTSTNDWYFSINRHIDTNTVGKRKVMVDSSSGDIGVFAITSDSSQNDSYEHRWTDLDQGYTDWQGGGARLFALFLQMLYVEKNRLNKGVM